MSIETMWCEEIKSELEELKKQSVGTDEYRTTVDGITKMYDRYLERKRLDQEREEKERDRENEVDLKLKELAEARRDQRNKNIISVIGIGAPLVVASVWGVLSMTFEERGTITTSMGKACLNKLLRIK